MTLKPEHIVEELNRTPKLKRDLIMKMMEVMLDSEAFLEAYPRLYDPALAEVSSEYREKVREELAQIIVRLFRKNKVRIYFMLTGGKMPSEKDISEMETFMMNEARRPMTDLVICKAPEEVEYSIDFTYYIGASSKKNADIVQQNVAQAVQEYQDWQRSIGRDINPMELIYRLRAAGVKRVEMREPAFKVVESGADKEKALVQIPKLSGQPTVVYGGVEDD